MSEQIYPRIAEKAKEDYHEKPRLFWAYWLVASHDKPQFRFVYDTAFEHLQEWPMPDDMLDNHQELREQLEDILQTLLQKSNVCRDESAGVQ